MSALSFDPQPALELSRTTYSRLIHLNHLTQKVCRTLSHVDRRFRWRACSVLKSASVVLLFASLPLEARALRRIGLALLDVPSARTFRHEASGGAYLSRTLHRADHLVGAGTNREAVEI